MSKREMRFHFDIGPYFYGVVCYGSLKTFFQRWSYKDAECQINIQFFLRHLIIRKKIEMVGGPGCFTACILLAYMPIYAGLHQQVVSRTYLLIDLLLNHLFSPIHILQLLYDFDSLSPQHTLLHSSICSHFSFGPS